MLGALDAQTQRLGNLLRGASFEMAQGKGRALDRRECRHAALDGGGDLGAPRQALGTGPLGYRLVTGRHVVHLLREVLRGVTLAAPQGVERTVRGDAVQPGADL